MPHTWYARPVRNIVALQSGRTPFAVHADVTAGATGAIASARAAAAARQPAEWHRRRRAPGRGRAAPGDERPLAPFYPYIIL